MPGLPEEREEVDEAQGSLSASRFYGKLFPQYRPELLAGRVSYPQLDRYMYRYTRPIEYAPKRRVRRRHRR